MKLGIDVRQGQHPTTRRADPGRACSNNGPGPVDFQISVRTLGTGTWQVQSTKNLNWTCDEDRVRYDASSDSGW